MLNQSETVSELAAALSAAQSKLEGFKKDAQNPFFKSDYGTLASVWDAIRESLTANGLAVVQTPIATLPEDGRIGIRTVLMHKSGQWIAGDLYLRPSKPDPQAAGSAITYARRYALAAIVGIAPADDDGEAAMSRPKDVGKAVYGEPPAQKRERKQAEAAAKVTVPTLAQLYDKAKSMAMPDGAWKDLLDGLQIQRDKRTQTEARLIQLDKEINEWKKLQDAHEL